MLGEVLGVERRRRWSDDEKLEIVLATGAEAKGSLVARSRCSFPSR